MSTQRRVRIVAGGVTREALLNDSETAKAIWEALPIDGRVQRWGDEIYFGIPVERDEEAAHAREVVDVGDLAYWPPGNAFCIFWGRTPASRGDEVRAASPVNVFGRVEKDAEEFGAVRTGEPISIERADE